MNTLMTRHEWNSYEVKIMVTVQNFGKIDINISVHSVLTIIIRDRQTFRYTLHQMPVVAMTFFANITIVRQPLLFSRVFAREKAFHLFWGRFMLVLGAFCSFSCHE